MTHLPIRHFPEGMVNQSLIVFFCFHISIHFDFSSTMLAEMPHQFMPELRYNFKFNLLSCLLIVDTGSSLELGAFMSLNYSQVSVKVLNKKKFL